jgi:hypothetical protein
MKVFSPSICLVAILTRWLRKGRIQELPGGKETTKSYQGGTRFVEDCGLKRGWQFELIFWRIRGVVANSGDVPAFALGLDFYQLPFVERL